MRKRSDTKAKTADHGHWPFKLKIMKKAMIVNFYVATRIIVDVESSDELSDIEFYDAVQTARDQIVESGIENYINSDNVENIYEDTELPYPQNFDI